MTGLKEMQTLFQRAVMGGDKTFLPQIEAGGRLTPEKRLNIYQHAYKARLRDVLREDFPVLHSMLGDEVFYDLCNQYIDAYPSSHPSLRYFGQYLEQFLACEKPYKEQAIIAEMAQFEWTFHNVFDALDHDIITIEAVGALSPSVWTTLRFDFHPSLYISAYKWNVAAVWSSVQEEDEPVLPAELPEVTNIIQWRRDLRSYFRTLDPDEGPVLRLAMGKKAFPDICGSLVSEHGENAPARAAELLKNWVVEGLVASLDHMEIKR